MKRLTLVALAALLAVSACNRDRKDEAPAPDAAGSSAPVTTGDAAPLAFNEKTEFAEVALSLPAGIRAHPDLHVPLYAEEMRKLRQFQEGSQSDRTEEGGETLPPYAKSVTFKAAADTGKLYSLLREDYDFSGGAHPNTTSTGLLWDKALKRQIGAADLFRAGADLTTLDQALCTAINQAKRERVPDGQTVTLDGESFRCPRAAATPFVLAPGTVGGRAGGLTFLVAPYVVGPYAEGGYEISLPQASFRSFLNPAYADEFAGAPQPQA